jgi:predicted MFS family arabinose efflux permease
MSSAEGIGEGGLPVAGERRRLVLLQLVAIVSTLDRFAVAPMLLAISADLGVPFAETATVATAYFLTYGVLQPVWGMVSDRLGRVRTLRLSLSLAALTGLASAVAPTLALLVVARAAAGACFAAAVPTALVYVGDTVPAARRQARVTDVMTGVAAGTALATAVAGALAEHLSWRWAFAATAVVAGLLAAALRRLPEPVRHAGHGGPGAALRVLRRPWPVVVLALAFTEGFVLLGLFTFVPSAVEDSGRSATVAGGVTAVYGLAVLLAAQVVKRLSAVVPAWRLMAVGGGLAVTGLAVLAAWSATVAGVAAACVVLGGAWAFLHSSLQTWATEVAPDARAAAVSLFAGLLFAGSAVGAAVAAPPAAAGRFGLVFLLGALVAAPLGVAAALARRRWTPG